MYLISAKEGKVYLFCRNLGYIYMNGRWDSTLFR